VVRLLGLFVAIPSANSLLPTTSCARISSIPGLKCAILPLEGFRFEVSNERVNGLKIDRFKRHQNFEDATSRHNLLQQLVRLTKQMNPLVVLWEALAFGHNFA
jgi:hypothetical protein